MRWDDVVVRPNSDFTPLATSADGSAVEPPALTPPPAQRRAFPAGDDDSARQPVATLALLRRASDRAATPSANDAPAPFHVPQRPEKDRTAFFELHFHPLLLVDRQGRVLDANAAARADIRDGRIGLLSDGLLRLGARDCARRFQIGLAEAATDAQSWHRLVVRMSDGEWRLTRLRALPEVDHVALVEIQPSAADHDADISPLARAFALTVAETAVLSNLLDAQAPKEIARALGISSHTVRAHMRAIYAKLGVRARSGMMRTALRLVS